MHLTFQASPQLPLVFLTKHFLSQRFKRFILQPWQQRSHEFQPWRQWKRPGRLCGDHYTIFPAVGGQGQTSQLLLMVQKSQGQPPGMYETL